MAASIPGAGAVVSRLSKISISMETSPIQPVDHAEQLVELIRRVDEATPPTPLEDMIQRIDEANGE